MGNRPRTITMKRGVRYNWRESLESILESGELSKFTVKPSGTLHLYITRPSKNKPRNPKAKTKKKRRQKKLCSSWIHLARSIIIPRMNKRSTVREQCIQTDCTIPVCFELDDGEEVCPCSLRLNSPISTAPKSRNGHFREPLRPPFDEIAEPSFARNIAVPKTKPRSHRGTKQSATQTNPDISPKSSGHIEKRQHSIDSIPQRDSASNRKNTNTLKPRSSNKFPPPTPQSKRNSSLQKSTRDSDSNTTEGQRRSGLTPQSSEKRKHLQFLNPDTPEITENSLKPTVGLAQLASLNQSDSYPKFTPDQRGRRKFYNRWETSRTDTWDSYVQDSFYPNTGSQYSPPADYRILQQNRNHVKRSREKNLNGTFWKVYSSHNYLKSSSKRDLTESNCDKTVRLRRKNGSYKLGSQTAAKSDNARKPQPRYYPLKLTHWPSPKFGSKESSDVAEHNVYQQIYPRKDLDLGTINAGSSKPDLYRLVPNRLRKVYSYYEIVSDSSLVENAVDSAMPTSPNTDAIATTEIYPAVTPHLSSEKSNDEVRDFLLRIKNVLSGYFNENCEGKRKFGNKRHGFRKFNWFKLKNEQKNLPCDKKKVHQKKTKKEETKESMKLMGLRYCY